LPGAFSGFLQLYFSIWLFYYVSGVHSRRSKTWSEAIIKRRSEPETTLSGEAVLTP
jgi:hypothetical protein